MSDTRIGLIGAGYIATWHADTLSVTDGVTITAVVDPNETAARGLAEAYGATPYTSVEAMIEAGACDAVHILTPPHLHEALAIQCLEAGLHVLVEKPVAESAEGTQRMVEAARAAGRTLSAGHNFLGLPAYTRLKAAMQAGAYGRISAAEINWCFPLAPLRSGPFNLWLLREPKNLLLELGPHLMGFAVDLFGAPVIKMVKLSKPVDLPGEDTRYQSWRILAAVGDVDVTFNISLVETVDDRSVTLRGSTARARMDYAANTLIVDRENPSDLIVNPLRRQLDQSLQHLGEGLRNAGQQMVSLNRKSPYGLSFMGMKNAVYGGIASGKTDARFSGDSALTVMRALDETIALAPDYKMQAAAPAVQTRAPKPSALVIGGTGFIGRALTRRLVADGRDVRVLSRGKTGPFPDLPDAVETVGASLSDKDALVEAMQGIDVVFNLAKALETTWDAALRNDVGVAVRVAEAVEQAGVKRLVYTGTIASYDMSDPKQQITEDTGFAEDMQDRNLYARSKAECERQLMQMHRERGLPVVIARPGIVVGPGGPLQHWGIGRWHGAGAVRIWGHGRNILPFVLNDDIADGLVRMIDAPVEGQSFNLIGEPMFSARDYFDAIHTALGARIRVAPGNLYAFYASDAVKYALKKYALRRHGVIRPSLADWKSRAHFSPFLNTKPKSVLDWQPETDKTRFIENAITQANLIGF